MSREIKFRAWSIKKRKYIDIDTLYCANGKVCGIVSNGVVYDADDVILEQDTGLKDENGKRICEGDIVMCGDWLMRVVWEKDFASFEVVYPDNNIEYDVFARASIEWVVIGNIQENPELLKN